MKLLRTKSIEESIAHTAEPEHQLKKNLSALDLTVFGIGVVIGAGIFTVTGMAAAEFAGPAIVFSFVLAAVCCGLAALCYAEFASTVPVAGSAYTFSYASLGEIIAWIVGWDLLLEMILAASVVAQGWSTYFVTLLEHFGLHWPEAVAPGTGLDLPAVLLVLVLTALIAKGIKESMRVNLVLVVIKVAIVLFVIVAGLQFIDVANYTPFIPPSQPGESSEGLHAPLLQVLFGLTPSSFGWLGIVSGASIVFFAYIGFDVVATTAEEARNPQRDLPIGIIASLTICAILYVAVALVLTGMMPYHEIDPKAALAAAFTAVGKPGYATIISAGAVAGLTTVVMTLLIGGTRVVFAMSRDRLLPEGLSKTSRNTGTPVGLTWIVGIAVAAISGLTPIGKLEEMVNIGTLAAFTLVSLAVPVLRIRRPDLPRAFRVPLSPVLPLIAALVCIYLMLNLSVETWLRFIIWMVVGVAIYYLYGLRHSRLNDRDREPPPPGSLPKLSPRVNRPSDADGA